MTEKLAHLPTNPGCYLMLNAHGSVIYVGKAKNIKSRVKSYFVGAHNDKTAALVKEIVDFNYVITNSEQESLLLEFNLIKQYQPRYNIRLIDDKSFPYIEITNEKHPRLIVSRQKQAKQGKLLFGPYPNAYAAKQTVRLLQKIYPLRRCSNSQKKACLYYHIGQCLGACAGIEVDYNPNILAISTFLKGNTAPVLKDLKAKMKQASDELNYEQALEYRNLIDYVQKTTEKQIVSLNDFLDKDFIGFAYNDKEVAINIINMRQGQIMDTNQAVFEYVSDIFDAVLVYLVSYYEKVLVPDEIVVGSNFNKDNMKLLLGDVLITTPQKGDKKKLLDLCLDNAKSDLLYSSKVKQSKAQKHQLAITKLEDIVGTNVQTIEVFDNAHLFGVAPISGMIVFKHNTFEKTSYRKFNLTSTTNDDYQAFREVINRRYSRLLIEGGQLPDLICVDGAKGQVNATIQTLASLGLSIPVIGLKKGAKHEITGIVYNNKSISLDVRDPLYLFLASLSEEVHRYTISFHRQSRNKRTYSSVLDSVKGIGKVKREALLEKYPTLDAIKAASVDDLRSIGLSDKIVKQLKEGAK